MQLELNSRRMVKYLGKAAETEMRGDPSLSLEVSKRKRRSLRGELKETRVPSKEEAVVLRMKMRAEVLLGFDNMEVSGDLDQSSFRGAVGPG